MCMKCCLNNKTELPFWLHKTSKIFLGAISFHFCNAREKDEYYNPF